jgi:hypothetical protein
MMLASFMDTLSVAWDAINIATLAHCDAVRRTIHSITEGWPRASTPKFSAEQRPELQTQRLTVS